ncbi:MAG: putative RNA-binding protein [Acidimicrobiaceae bacterium]|nr:putative RNA-binding protein [Acidimicrobiaceae bacterium]
MEWVETTGRSLAAALESALDELGVDEQDAEVVIVEEPRNGFLGIGRNEARVRARVRPSAPRPKRPQRGRRERGAGRGGGADKASGRGNDATSQPGSASRRPGGKGGAKPASAERDETSRGSDERRSDEQDAEAPLAGATGSQSTRRRRGGRGRGSAKTDGAGQRVRTSEKEEEQMSVDQQAELAGSFVRGVVERFGFDATTEVEITEEHVAVAVNGNDLGLLVGPRGTTLDALQELTRTVVQRRGEEHGTRIVVDVAGFRARRAAALESFTRRIVDEVLASGTPEALEPMSAADRKIVHDAVNGIDGVETTSEGTDPRRYVVIRPSGRADVGNDVRADEAGEPDEG